MNDLDIICFDFETGGLKAGYHEAIEIGAVAYNGTTLEPYPASQGGEFVSLMRPVHFDRLSPEAQSVHGITPEELRGAPEQGVVWRQFIEWVGRFRKKGALGAPIAAGKNIRNFDLGFVDELNRLHGPKKEKTVLFNARRQLDLEDLIYWWFLGSDELPNHKMDTLRQYFGLAGEEAHRALPDAREEGEVIMRFLRLKQKLRALRGKDGHPVIQFRGSCARGVACG